MFANKTKLLYNNSMELQQVANFINGRYLVTNLKADKRLILKGNLLASYSVDSLGKSKNEKIYYDTPDFFFADKGINIYTVSDGKSRELVIRYDSAQVQRIEFLKNTPNFFKVKIDKNDSIMKYSEQINEAIYKVFPEGLHVNIDDMLRSSSPRIRVFKKRDSYRVVNNKGLKVTMSFDIADYFKIGTKARFSQNNLDVVGDTFKSKDMFREFLNSLIIDSPQLIKIDSNELTFARKNLD